MNRLMKTGILINRRSFSSLNVNQQSRFVLSHRSENIPRQCCHCRSISTFESIYLKLISLPAVHYVEDSLAYIHDTTGIAMVQYSTVQKLSVCRATLERLHHGVHCPPPPGPHPPGPRDPAEGDGQEIYHGGGNEEGNIARHTEND